MIIQVLIFFIGKKNQFSLLFKTDFLYSTAVSMLRIDKWMKIYPGKYHLSNFLLVLFHFESHILLWYALNILSHALKRLNSFLINRLKIELIMYFYIVFIVQIKLKKNILIFNWISLKLTKNSNSKKIQK